MQNTKVPNRVRFILMLLFMLLGVLMVAAWVVTGQREMFETPTLLFGATGMILLFGFF